MEVNENDINIGGIDIHYLSYERGSKRNFILLHDSKFEDLNEGICYYIKHYPETDKNKSSVERRIESQKAKTTI